MDGSEGAAVRPEGIGQIAVSVEDLDRATAFYRDVLGLRHLFSAPPGLAFFSCGDVRLMLSAPEADGDEARGPNRTILYYRVAELDRAHDGLVAAGTEVVSPPHLVHRSDTIELWIGFYRDPEGNLFGAMAETWAGGPRPG